MTVAPSDNQEILAEQETKLAGLTNQLRAAYRGLEIEWWDDTARGRSAAEGSGAAHPDLFDDEDYGGGEGSGGFEGSGEEEEYDEAPIPSKPWNPWKTTTKAPVVVEREPVVTAGAPHVSVYRVVTAFILPAVTCYVGGMATSLPFFLS